MPDDLPPADPLGTWLAGSPRTRTRFAEPARFREGLYRLSPRAYAWMVPNGSWGETNIGLIDAGGQSILIDTCWDLDFTREMLGHAAPILQASPVAMVINTHADGDHCWGNQLFGDRPIIATSACIEQIHHLKPRSLQALQLASPLLRHVPWGGLAEFGQYMHQMLRPYDFRTVQLTPPNQSFCGDKHLSINGLDLHLIEVGPGHTNGDCIVHVPREQATYAGDILFVGVTPVMWAGPVERLVSALQRLLTLKTRVIVPGHGPLATPADVQQVIDYWDFVHEALQRCCRQGQHPADAARQTIQSAQFQAQPFARWDSAERLVSSAFTMYRNWGVRLPQLPHPLGTMDIMRRQAGLAFDLPHLTPGCMHRASGTRHGGAPLS